MLGDNLGLYMLHLENCTKPLHVQINVYRYISLNVEKLSCDRIMCNNSPYIDFSNCFVPNHVHHEGFSEPRILQCVYAFCWKFVLSVVVTLFSDNKISKYAIHYKSNNCCQCLRIQQPILPSIANLYLIHFNRIFNQQKFILDNLNY